MKEKCDFFHFYYFFVLWCDDTRSHIRLFHVNPDILMIVMYRCIVPCVLEKTQVCLVSFKVHKHNSDMPYFSFLSLSIRRPLSYPVSPNVIETTPVMAWGLRCLNFSEHFRAAVTRHVKTSLAHVRCASASCSHVFLLSSRSCCLFSRSPPFSSSLMAFDGDGWLFSRRAW